MRRAGAMVARALEEASAAVRPGITTEELDRIAEDTIRGMGGTPSFKGYHGYPATICASINEEIVHGIPGARVLREGDLISIDVGAIWQGYQGDAAITVAVGSVSPEAERLMEVTRRGLEAGIAAARAGGRLGDISHAIEVVARAAGLEVIREYGGHTRQLDDGWTVITADLSLSAHFEHTIAITDDGAEILTKVRH